MRRYMVAGVCLLAAAGPLWAGDGVIEINAVRAELGGVTSGDPGGFPVVISEAGSYRLTSDLVVPDPSTTAIIIDATDVSLDLNGFNIGGFTECPGPAEDLGCAPLGGGDGIRILSAGRVTIENGAIFGMGDRGIDRAFSAVGSEIRVRNVRVSHNGGGGIDLRAVDEALVSGCDASRNGGPGIFIGTGQILSSAARGNGDTGLLGFRDGVVIQESRSVGNALDGIKTFGKGLAKDNVLLGNGAFGAAFFIAEIGWVGNVLNGNSSDFLGGTQLGLNLCDGSPCGGSAR